MKREYKFTNDLDPGEMADDLDALYICAEALLAAVLHGALTELPAAGKVASACSEVLPQIQHKAERESIQEAIIIWQSTSPL